MFYSCNIDHYEQALAIYVLITFFLTQRVPNDAFHAHIVHILLQVEQI